MHEGCASNYTDGKQVADKVRMMGYDRLPITVPLNLVCKNCNDTFFMNTMVSKCPNCNMVYAVTPCHSNDGDSVLAAGIDY